MYTYEEFLKAVTEGLEEALGQEYCVELARIPKNNRVVLEGLTISKEQDSLAPVIYMNSYYEAYQENGDMESIICEIRDVYTEEGVLPEIRPEELENFSCLAGKVAFKLVNAESNREYLQHVPHVPWLDLAVVFYLMLDKNQYGHMTAVIHNSHMTAWGTSVEELYQLAEHNTPELLPIEIKSMDDVMREVLIKQMGEEGCEEVLEELEQIQGAPPLYVMSNISGINGASSMLTGGVLKEFADSQKADLVILPSSVHEVLLIPREEGLDFEELFQMVRSVNETTVPEVDRLSDQVYQYCREEEKIYMVDMNGMPIRAVEPEL